MAVNVTTLSAAVLLTDTIVNVTSATGITAPNYQIGDPTKGISGGVTYLFIDQELMKVVGIAGTAVQVVRGELGSIAATHTVNAVVMAGLPADFPGWNPAVASAVPQYPIKYQGFSGVVASAAAITAPSAFFHVSGTTALTTMAPPAGYEQGGEVNIVFDGAGSWATGGAVSGTVGAPGTFYPFLASSTATQTGTLASFILDLNIQKWIPSRL
jgi:hypothetical protein